MREPETIPEDGGQLRMKQISQDGHAIREGPSYTEDGRPRERPPRSPIAIAALEVTRLEAL